MLWFSHSVKCLNTVRLSTLLIDSYSVQICSDELCCKFIMPIELCCKSIATEMELLIEGNDSYHCFSNVGHVNFPSNETHKPRQMCVWIKLLITLPHVSNTPLYHTNIFVYFKCSSVHSNLQIFLKPQPLQFQNHLLPQQ